MQCLLSPLDSVLANPRCKSHALKCGGGFGLNASISDAPEINMLTCGLLPVIMANCI